MGLRFKTGEEAVKHYLVDIERGEYLSVGTFLTSQIEAASLTYGEIIIQLKEAHPSQVVSKGYLSQLTSDREKIPLRLITPLIDVILCEKSARARKYYISEILKTYLPAELRGFITSPLTILKKDAERDARNSANWRFRNRENPCSESAFDEDNWLELAMRPKLLDPIDFELFERKGVELNTYRSKREKNKVKATQSKKQDEKSIDDVLIVDKEFIEMVGQNKQAQEKTAKNRHHLFGHILRPRLGDCLANAIIQMQQNKPMYFQHKYTKEGRTLPDPVFLSICYETYSTNGGNVSLFEKLLMDYYEQIEQRSKKIIQSPEEEPYIDTWESNHLSRSETRDKLLLDYKDQRVQSIEDAKIATQKSFERHYFFKLDQFFEDNERALFRLRYEDAKKAILRDLVGDWSSDNLLEVDILDQSMSQQLYKEFLSGDEQKRNQTKAELSKTWARKGFDNDDWFYWYCEDGPSTSEMREELYYQRYSYTFFHFFEQQLIRLKNNVRQLKK